MTFFCVELENSDYLNAEVWRLLNENFEFVSNASSDSSLRYKFMVYEYVVDQCHNSLKNITVGRMKEIFDQKFANLTATVKQQYLSQSENSFDNLVQREYFRMHDVVKNLGLNLDVIGLTQEWKVWRTIFVFFLTDEIKAIVAL